MHVSFLRGIYGSFREKWPDFVPLLILILLSCQHKAQIRFRHHHLLLSSHTMAASEETPIHPLLSPTNVKAGSFSLRYKPISPSNTREQYYETTDDTNDAEVHNHSPLVPRWLHQTIHRIHNKIPLPILLLSAYLALTLCAFWILDSIKDPTLAALVPDNDLGNYQPKAKMVSFGVVVGIVLGVELLDGWHKKNLRTKRSSFGGTSEEGNSEIELSWQERDLPSSSQQMTHWRKMKVVPERIWNAFQQQYYDDGGEESMDVSSKLSTTSFYLVGSVYIHFFITVAILLRRHPAFRPNTIFHDVTEVVQLQSGGLDAFPSSEFQRTNKIANNNFTDTDDNYYIFLGYALYALIESFGSVSIAIFWSFANSHLSLETAERHYGSIVAVAQAGAIGGSTLSTVLGGRRGKSGEFIENKGSENDAQVTIILIFVACACIALGMGVMALYGRWFSKITVSEEIVYGKEVMVQNHSLKDLSVTKKREWHSMQPSSEAREDGVLQNLLSGLHLIFRYEYLKLVLAVSVLYEIALTCMHYELNLIGLDRFGVGVSIQDESSFNDSKKKGITYIQFMGWYGQTVNVLSLFLSFYAFPRLIKHYGLSTTIRIFPTFLLVVTICAFVIFPHNLPFLFVALSICKALTYSVHDPSEEVLYMPTSDDVKFKAKFWIDVVGQRVAKALGSAINNYAGSIEGIVKYGSLPSIVASIALWMACYQVGVLFDVLLQSGDVVGLDDVQNEGLEMTEQYPSDEDEEEKTSTRSPLFRDVKETIVPPSLEEGSAKVNVI